MIFDHEIDEPRPMKAICIGAGISGLLTGIRVPQQVPNLEMVIYDKNADVGGTWFENKSVKPLSSRLCANYEG